MSARQSQQPVGIGVAFFIGFILTFGAMARALLGASSPLRPESTTVGNANLMAMPIVWVPVLAIGVGVAMIAYYLYLKR